VGSTMCQRCPATVRLGAPSVAAPNVNHAPDKNAGPAIRRAGNDERVPDHYRAAGSDTHDGSLRRM